MLEKLGLPVIETHQMCEVRLNSPYIRRGIFQISLKSIARSALPIQGAGNKYLMFANTSLNCTNTSVVITRTLQYHLTSQAMENRRKIAVLTGGSRGLGRDMVLNLSKNGIDVIFSYNSNKNKSSAHLNPLRRGPVAPCHHAVSSSVTGKSLSKLNW